MSAHGSATRSLNIEATPFEPLIPAKGFTGELQRGNDVWLRARWYGAGRGGFGGRDAFAGEAETPYSMQYYQYGYSAPTMWSDASGETHIPDHGHACVMSDGMETMFSASMGILLFTCI